jgi:hypothetical protein
MAEPFTALSPWRKAGFPPIITVVLPTPKGPGTLPETGVAISPTTAAGIPPIKTLGAPAPVIIPSAVGSAIRAAKGIFLNFIFYILYLKLSYAMRLNYLNIISVIHY